MSGYKPYSLTESQFELIFDRLLSEPKVRKQFFMDPEGSLKQFNTTLAPEEINRIKNINCKAIKEDTISFNEKLVLCSSSGY